MSYSIMGNDEAWGPYSEYIELVHDSVPNIVFEVYPKGLPDNIFQELVNKNLNQLVQHAYKKKSRLVFIILRVFLMMNLGNNLKFL